jgi:hypothetical protein
MDTTLFPSGASRPLIWPYNAQLANVAPWISRLPARGGFDDSGQMVADSSRTACVRVAVIRPQRQNLQASHFS